MRASGKMIFNMVKEKKPGQMDLFTKVTTQQGKNMALGPITGTMGQDMKANGVKIK